MRHHRSPITCRASSAACLRRISSAAGASGRCPSITRYYNPLSYHRGTVWAVEQATIIFGLRRFGFDARALDLARALFDLAQLYPEHRMPECVGGYARGERPTPGAYPQANTPQLWNATAFPLTVQTLLGIVPVAQLRARSCWIRCCRRGRPKSSCATCASGGATVDVAVLARRAGRIAMSTCSSKLGTLAHRPAAAARVGDGRHRIDRAGSAEASRDRDALIGGQISTDASHEDLNAHTGLREQVMVITGASSGIGLVTARQAAATWRPRRRWRRGTSATCSRRSTRFAGSGGRAIYVVTDVADPAQVERLAEAAVARVRPHRHLGQQRRRVDVRPRHGTVASRTCAGRWT